jgi:hypothetical protein
MKRVISICIAALSFSLAACDSGSTSDPATAGRDDLNPPSGLITVTGDKQIELRFSTANAEGEDFKGYHVFAAKSSAVESATVGYPVGATLDKLGQMSIPRCVTNTSLFQAVGCAATDRDCEGDTASDEGTAEGGAEAGEGMFMQDDAAAEGEEKLTNMVICDGNTDTTISLPVSGGKSLGEQKCVVKKAWDGTALADLVNGETYTFFVVAVLGEDKSNISWTSNFVEDTPAVPVYNKADFVIKATNFYFIPAAKLATLAAITDADITEASCDPDGGTAPKNVCRIYNTNEQAEDGIYIGRFGGENPTRIFISTPTDSAITMELRGNQTVDPANPGAASTSIPGDQAIVSETYESGRLYPSYGPVVYDLKWTKDASTVHYGKLILGQATRDEAVAGGLGDMTTSLTIIMQPGPNNPHYMQ